MLSLLLHTTIMFWFRMMQPTNKCYHMGSYLLSLVETFVHLTWSLNSLLPTGHEVVHGNFDPTPRQLEGVTSEIRGNNRHYYVANYIQQVTDNSEGFGQNNHEYGLMYR